MEALFSLKKNFEILCQDPQNDVIRPEKWFRENVRMDVRTRKKCILEELPNSSETEDMRKIR